MRFIISVVFVVYIAGTVLAEETKAEPKAVEADDKLEAADRNERQINDWLVDPWWAGPARPARLPIWRSGRSRIPPYRPTIDPGWAGPAYYGVGRRTPPYRPTIDPWFAGPAKPSWWRSRYPVGTKPALTTEVEACKILCPSGPIPEWY